MEGHIQNREQEHDSASWHMWHGALLTRSKQLPPLADFLTSKPKTSSVPKLDEAAIRARFDAYRKQYKKEHKANG